MTYDIGLPDEFILKSKEQLARFSQEIAFRRNEEEIQKKLEEEKKKKQKGKK